MRQANAVGLLITAAATAFTIVILSTDLQNTVHRISARYAFTKAYFSPRPYTELPGVESVTNDSSIVDKLRYVATDTVDNGTGTQLLAELSLYKDIKALSKLGYPLESFTHQESLSQFVFATAASQFYLHIAMDTVARIQEFFPNNVIYFYDLSDGDFDTKIDKIRRLCKVRYRKFVFGNYPQHIQELQTYAWKPIIVHELLKDHETIFWVDSSIRFQTSNLQPVYQQALNKSRGLVLFDHSGHNIFMATHSGMYRYLPITKESAVNASMRGANAIFIHRNKQLYDHVLRWWFLCALERGCIAPTKELFCKFHGRTEYAHCHRYDQSALAILLTHYFHGDDRAYWYRPSKAAGHLLTVERGSQHKEQVAVCPEDGSVTRTKSRNYF